MEDRERASFEELALPLLDSLYRYAQWLTRDRTEAEDLVQEAYLKGIRGFESFIAGNAQALRRAIEELPVEFREVLLLCDAEGMSYKEIAETLSIPMGTVTSRLLRARQKIRKALAHEER